jgi:hypothetical protein
MQALPYAIAALLLAACSADRPATETQAAARAERGTAAQPSESGSTEPGDYSLTIDPSDAAPGAMVYLEAEGFDLSDATVRWRLNDAPVAPDAPDAFDTAELSKGDRLQAIATVQGEEVRSNVVQIRNSPPELAKVALVSAPGPSLAVDAAADDADGDEVTLIYQWTLNGEPAGEGRTLAAKPARGDKLTVRVTPFDGTDRGVPVVLQREVANLPPVIVQDTAFEFDGDLFIHQVKASDPDGDRLTFGLKDPPAGMKIDAASGRIAWAVPADFAGEARVTVTVADGKNNAQEELIFRISPPAKD